ncbi:MAG: pyrimidine dimer DNA glycosylase/endonuclease V [Candidatus Omnitrophota bacterium]
MRIWDISPARLCRNHLLGEHRELHAVWAVITQGKKGYSRHPETLRWKGKLKALFKRHALLVKEFSRRKYRHKSALDERLATGKAKQDIFVHPCRRQMAILRKKKCDCKV